MSAHPRCELRLPSWAAWCRSADIAAPCRCGRGVGLQVVADVDGERSTYAVPDCAVREQQGWTWALGRLLERLTAERGLRTRLTDRRLCRRSGDVLTTFSAQVDRWLQWWRAMSALSAYSRLRLTVTTAPAPYPNRVLVTLQKLTLPCLLECRGCGQLFSSFEFESGGGVHGPLFVDYLPDLVRRGPGTLPIPLCSPTCPRAADVRRIVAEDDFRWRRLVPSRRAEAAERAEVVAPVQALVQRAADATRRPNGRSTSCGR